MQRPKRLIRPGRTVDQVVRSLSDRILTGQLRPGEKLDEYALADLYDVSRTPVREALGRLSAMGLVERRPNRSATVAVVSPEYLQSMFESMAELESICARLAAERMTVAERRTLEHGHRDAARLVHLGAEDDYEEFNTEFHTRLYLGAHSPHITELTMQTRDRLAPFRRAQFRLTGRLAKSWQEHDAIVTAVLQADGPAAASSAKAHVSVVGEASAVFAEESHAAARPTAVRSGAPITGSAS